MTQILAWTVFFACVALAFVLLATEEGPLEARKRAREDEDWWNRDRQEQEELPELVFPLDEDAEPWGARR